MIKANFYSCIHSLVAQEPGYTEGDVRLAGTSKVIVDEPIGRLEVYMNGEWGTVCSVSQGAAEAICHQLGYQVEVITNTVVNLG